MADRYEHGLISWTDLSSPDVGAAKAFYTQLMGWEAEDQFDDDGNRIYVMLFKDGKAAAGLGPQPPDMADQGIPPMWATYIAVDDVDATVEAFTEAGGTIFLPPMDVMESGRMAMGADPTGAVVSFWQARDHRGADAFNEPGFLTWNELTTRQPQAATEFWTTVMPWNVEQMDMGGVPYYMFMLGDRPTGGVMTMGDDWPAEIPSHWMTYFRVDDADAAAARVAELGGQVPVPPFDTPQGRVCVINDPQGGTCSLIGPAPDAS